jgi:hypothetical protein
MDPRTTQKDDVLSCDTILLGVRHTSSCMFFIDGASNIQMRHTNRNFKSTHAPNSVRVYEKIATNFTRITKLTLSLRIFLRKAWYCVFVQQDGGRNGREMGWSV